MSFREAEARLWASEGVAPTERMLPLRRTGAKVRVQEAGEGPVVLFVHGASNCGASWAGLVGRLDGFRCVVLDRPGCGGSEPLPARLADRAGLEAYGDALVVDVLDALDVERAHLVGTSFGGYLTLRAMAAHPDRISRAVEIGWTFGAPIATTPIVMRMAGMPGLGRVLASIPPNERMVRTILKGAGLRQALAAGKVPQEVVDCYLGLLRDTRTMRNELDAGPRLITPIRGLNRDILLDPDVLGRVTTPVRFLWGDGDPFGGAEVARAFTAKIPDAELELVAGAGHAPWLDEPHHVAARTGDFLAA